MIKFSRGRAKKTGMLPGALVHVGEQKVDQVSISLTHYSDNRLVEEEFDDIKACFPYLELDGVKWISVRGLHDIEVIRELGNFLDLHPLLQEDLLNTELRPKVDANERCIVCIMKSFTLNQESDALKVEQVSIILGENFVISLEEQAEDLFVLIRERIRNNRGKIRKSGADYLAYALIDILVDQYFEVLDVLGEQLQDLEDRLASDQDEEAIKNIHYKKKQVIFLRRSIWPLRGIINYFVKEDTGLIKPETVIYLRDIYDHTVEIVETIEIYRENLSGILDIYLTSVNNRMNEVMKVLTVIATIFIPLTFIAGVYGMNFMYMPELHWWWAYPTVLAIMAGVGVLMILFFRRKKWL